MPEFRYSPPNPHGIIGTFLFNKEEYTAVIGDEGKFLLFKDRIRQEAEPAKSVEDLMRAVVETAMFDIKPYVSQAEDDSIFICSHPRQQGKSWFRDSWLKARELSGK